MKTRALTQAFGIFLLALLVLGTSCSLPARENPFGAVEGLVHRGKRLAAEGDLRGAERAFLEAIGIRPGSVEAHRELQNLLERRHLGHKVVGAYTSFFDFCDVVCSLRRRLRRPPAFDEAYRRLLTRSAEDKPSPLPRALDRKDRSNLATEAYLRGRIAGEADAQLRWFRRAVELDGRAFWPQYGLGYVCAKMKETDRARTHLGKAAEVNPRCPLPHLILGDIEASRYKLRAARRRLTRAAVLDPSDPRPTFLAAHSYFLEGDAERALGLCLALLPEHATNDRILKLSLRSLDMLQSREHFLEALGTAKRILRSSVSAQCEALAGYAAHHLGRLPEARIRYGRALRGGVNPALVLNDRRLLLFKTGEYGRAVELWKEKLPEKKVFSPENSLLPKLRELFVAAHEAQKKAGDPAGLVRLGRALRAVGWVREASEVYHRALAAGADEKLGAEAREIDSHLKLVRYLKNLFSAEYLAFLRTETKPTLDRILDQIGAVTLETLGKDLGQGNEVRDFSFIGSYLDPSKPEASPLVAYFRRFNQYFILGQRSGRTPEATLMSMVYLNPEEKVSFPGEELTVEVVLGENFEVRSLGEFSGGDLLGAALYHGFYVNVDAMAEKEFNNWATFLRYAHNMGDLVHYDSYPPGEGEPLDGVDDPFGLATLLLLKAYATRLGRTVPEISEEVLAKFEKGRIPQPMRLLFEGTYAHEAMHVLEARRYLPVGSHPIAALGMAMRHGFSPGEIEAAAEESAALAGLILSPAPCAELASIVSFLPYPKAQPPHSLGFYRLVRGMTGHILRHPDAFTSRPGGIDLGLGIFRQLHRLRGEDIRRIARHLAEKKSLFRFPSE
jgi:tetratricopeptide (TPR) repeat protein